MAQQTIVVIGDPTQGFSFHGPFDDTDVAVEWAECNASNSWWVADLEEVADGSAPVVSPANAKRVVYYTNEGFFDPVRKEYIVARVTEDEAGYDPYAAMPTIEGAKTLVAEMNGELGFDDETVLTVVSSSMRLGNRAWKEDGR